MFVFLISKAPDKLPESFFYNMKGIMVKAIWTAKLQT